MNVSGRCDDDFASALRDAESFAPGGVAFDGHIELSPGDPARGQVLVVR